MKTQLINAFNAAIVAEIIVLFLTLYTSVFNTPHSAHTDMQVKNTQLPAITRQLTQLITLL